MKRSASRNAGRAARAVDVRVPASTANLGAGFDCFGLALGLYLHVRARAVAGQEESFRMTYSGEGSDSLPPSAGNLIYRAAQRLAEREGFHLPPLDLEVKNHIPFGRGLGSSAAAIVAGILVAASFSRRRVPAESLLSCATEIEGHPDNVAAALYGGWVILAETPNEVVVVRRPWPRSVRAVIVSPEARIDTRESRRLLPAEIRREDAVFNLQRVALFGAAIEAGRTDLLSEAMRDRLHQPQRGLLVPGLAEALELREQPGLVGIALSGSGPSVLALATGHFREIGHAITDIFAQHSFKSTIRVLAAGVSGASVAGRRVV